MERINIIRNNVAEKILQENTNELIKYDSNCVFYALYDNDDIVSIIGLLEFEHTIRFKNNYTPIEYRNKGYFTELLEYILGFFDTLFTITAYCTEDSINIYYKNGFSLIKEYQRNDQKISFVRKVRYERN